ncbi:MAG: B12-binding domain-containing radical SAM protein [Kiritimatiellae bacterium]|nr:B12-binding domain-containing radical SAM protein [Kiritimatiellia bacterium]
MRVAIVYPPLPSEKGVPLLSQNRQFQWFSRPTYIFPVVPATAATMLKNAGHDVLWLDGIAEELAPEEFDERLIEFRPDCIVLETKTPVVKRHWQWISKHKSGRMANAKFVIVGDHVTAMPEETMENSPVDFVLTGGDWDFLLKNLVSAIDDDTGYEPGIWYRSGGVVKNTGRFQLNHDLKLTPWIDRELCKWRLYAVKNGNFRRTPGTYLMSGRDCWHAKCTFCSWTTLYPTYRTRDPVDVVDEIEYLVKEYGVKEIMDDSGSFPVGNFMEKFCAEMIQRGLNKKVSIDCNMRFGRLTSADYRLMKKAGFRLVLFGVESANQVTLDRFVKALKVEDIEQGARWASDAGLDVHLTFMFGHAWEGREEIANTVKLARRMLAKGYTSTLQCTLTIPYPGTPLFKELEAADGLTSLDWDEYDMRKAITKTPLVTEEEIKCAIRDVYRGFLQPEALLRRMTSTRTLFDFPFYYRGVRSLLGHLIDFRGAKNKKGNQP